MKMLKTYSTVLVSPGKGEEFVAMEILGLHGIEVLRQQCIRDSALIDNDASNRHSCLSNNEYDILREGIENSLNMANTTLAELEALSSLFIKQKIGDLSTKEPEYDTQRKPCAEFGKLLRRFREQSKMPYAKLTASRNYRRARAYLDNYDLVIRVAQVLVNVQAEYLRTREWSDKCRLTYLDLHHKVGLGTETKIRRDIVKHLKLRIGDDIIRATDLICTSDRPFLYCKIKVLSESDPRAGAPKLHRMLKKEGVKVSQRTVGNILAMVYDAKHLGYIN